MIVYHRINLNLSPTESSHYRFYLCRREGGLSEHWLSLKFDLDSGKPTIFQNCYLFHFPLISLLWAITVWFAAYVPDNVAAGRLGEWIFLEVLYRRQSCSSSNCVASLSCPLRMLIILFFSSSPLGLLFQCGILLAETVSLNLHKECSSCHTTILRWNR